MAKNMDDFQDLDSYLAENPNFLDNVNFDNNGLMTDADTKSLNPANLALNNSFGDLNGFSAPQELVPAVPEVPQLQIPNMAMGPCYHPMVGWYYPTGAPAGVPPPPMFPMTSTTPVTSVPPSAIPSGTSTPIPAAANPAAATPRNRPHGKRKYGPSAYLDACAEGRTGIGNDEANYFASNASRRDGRGDAKPDTFDNAFGRSKTRPSIVQACICEDHEAQRIKRPKNAFILYRLAKADEIRKTLGTTANQDVSKAASVKWKEEDKATKDRFFALAEEEKQRHAKMYPDYQYKPGGHTRSKFGTKDCRCGAYQLNMARFNEKRGGHVADTVADDSDVDTTFKPARSRPQAPAPTAVMLLPPNLDIASLGLPANQQAEAAALYTGLKRKHDLTVSTSRTPADDRARKRRTPRSSAGLVDYAEPDDAAPFDLAADDLFDFGASCKTPSSTQVEPYDPSPKDLRGSRQNSKVRSAPPAAATAASPLFLSPEAPAKSTRSRSRANVLEEVASSPLTPVADDDDEIVVATPKEAKSKAQSRSGSGASSDSARTTRSQTTRRRSLRSGGKVSR